MLAIRSPEACSGAPGQKHKQKELAMHFDDNTLIRFWSKVDKSKECWEWQGLKDRKGYGQFRFKESSRYAHRVSWMITNGPIPPGMLICHHCDNPSCVNPLHLFVGTPLDNTQDMLAKGRESHRGLKGEENPHAKLTREQVNIIRESKQGGSDLARRFGVSPSTIYLIRKGISWNR